MFTLPPPKINDALFEHIIIGGRAVYVSDGGNILRTISHDEMYLPLPVGLEERQVPCGGKVDVVWMDDKHPAGRYVIGAYQPMTRKRLLRACDETGRPRPGGFAVWVSAKDLAKCEAL